MDEIIQTAINELNNFLKETNWYGRENEVVNLFAHTFLTKHIGREESFTSMYQIGIEVAVKQITSQDGKKLVRKDLVIWKKKNQTVWNDNREPINDPIAILEWKVNSLSKCDVDIEWLKKFTTLHSDITGYSICAFVNGERGASYKKIINGEVF